MLKTANENGFRGGRNESPSSPPVLVLSRSRRSSSWWLMILCRSGGLSCGHMSWRFGIGQFQSLLHELHTCLDFVRLLNSFRSRFLEGLFGKKTIPLELRSDMLLLIDVRHELLKLRSAVVDGIHVHCLMYSKQHGVKASPSHVVRRRVFVLQIPEVGDLRNGLFVVEAAEGRVVRLAVQHETQARARASWSTCLLHHLELSDQVVWPLRDQRLVPALAQRLLSLQCRDRNGFRHAPPIPGELKVDLSNAALQEW
mmetsp:Transcript_24760/g.53839  ORF Transcript_24760/g.53839 Transcript_24760/m.53839 type:complete len:255 (-) Transcript_24760:3196-3960(-)